MRASHVLRIFSTIYMLPLSTKKCFMVTLFTFCRERFPVLISKDAGRFLCNYILYALTLPSTQLSFYYTLQ